MRSGISFFIRRKGGAVTEALTSTLGTKPQVVTTAVDLLLSDGHPITRVVVLHTSGGQALTPAIDRLCAEFSTYPPHRRLTFQPRPITGPDGFLSVLIALVLRARSKRYWGKVRMTSPIITHRLGQEED